MEGAASYLLVATAKDREDVVLSRPVREVFLKPTESDVVNFNPGAYTWTVEARSPSGRLIGYGESSFSIGAGN